MKTLIIPRKMSGTGTIHDVSSDLGDREIIFSPDCLFAVVDASYYGGKGYTTHKSETATINASRKNRAYSHVIIDTDGNNYAAYYGDRLVKI